MSVNDALLNPDYFVELEKPTNGPTGGKFWIVETYGPRVVLRWGAVKTKGQCREKTFGSPAMAVKHATRREDEKLSEGYRVVSRTRPRASAAGAAGNMTPPEPPAPEPNVSVVTDRALVWDF